ncbi:outer membrane lipoprotein carrier protein LolA [Deinococcus sp. VB343]|uniref:Outer membrane lipoprotein carrier protein LolA n=1 Tax=Deinococcus sp. VB142 TaxID=3112952 RepID=A0AAU6Q310_9DEIO
MRQILSLALLIGLGSASAQSAQDIINRVDSTQKAAKDISFRVTGQTGFQGSTQAIDFTVKTIPAQSLARLQFLAPDALADNVVVADKKEVRQYLFLTNQITVTPLNKAAGNAGLSDLDFTQLSNPSALLKSYDVKLLGTTGSAGKRLFQLEAKPKNGTERTRVWISESGWRPTRVQVLDNAGKSVADLNISSYKINSGLSAAGLRQLPKNAQIIRQ